MCVLLELPKWGSSNKYLQSMFWTEIWKISEFLSENFHFFLWWNFQYIWIDSCNPWRVTFQIVADFFLNFSKKISLTSLYIHIFYIWFWKSAMRGLIELTNVQADLGLHCLHMQKGPPFMLLDFFFLDIWTIIFTFFYTVLSKQCRPGSGSAQFATHLAVFRHTN